MQLSKAGVELLSVGLGEISAERVECDVDASTIGFEFENLCHDFGGLTASNTRVGVDPVVEVLKVVLVKSVADNLNIELVEVLMAQGTLEIGSEGGLNEHTVVQLFDVCGDAESGHCLEPAQGVASLEQFTGISLVQSSGDKKGDVINHVSIGQEVHELGQRSRCVGLEVAEFGDELVQCLVCKSAR